MTIIEWIVFILDVASELLKARQEYLSSRSVLEYDWMSRKTYFVRVPVDLNEVHGVGGSMNTHNEDMAFG